MLDNITDLQSPYIILNVSEDASLSEIKKAHRILALQYHPDKNDGASEAFIKVQWAYEILSNSEKRSAYDKFGYIDGDDSMESVLQKFNGELEIDLGELRSENFGKAIKKSIKDRISQRACPKCDSIGIIEEATGFLITKKRCSKCKGTGFVTVPEKDSNPYGSLGVFEKTDRRW